MKKLCILISILFFTCRCNAQDQVVVDPNAEMRALNGSFNAIQVSGGIDLYLTQSATEAIAVSASEEKFKEGIRINVENNVLKIYFDGAKGWSMKSRQLKVYVSFTNLQSLHASGASDVSVAGKIAVPELEMKLSGASDFKGCVAVNTLDLNLSGASDVHICGTASIISIESSGASDINGFDLVTEQCTANASGASDIDITVNKEISVKASGASEITFSGNAVIKDVHKTGASTVGRKS